MTLSKEGAVFRFHSPVDNALPAFESAIGSPINIDQNSFSGKIPLLIEESMVLSLKIETEKKGDSVYSLTLGPDVVLKFLELGSVELGSGIMLTASTQNGPFGTIKNKQNESINQAIHKVNYHYSVDFYLSNFED